MRYYGSVSWNRRTSPTPPSVTKQVKRINELNEFIEQQDSELTDFDESLARRWLKEIVVWDDRFSVELKSGVRIEIDV